MGLFAFAAALCCLQASASFSDAQEPSPFRIAIVKDGPWERNAEFQRAFEDEILALTRGEFDVRFPPEKQVEADWTVPGVHRVIDALLEDPSVDAVVASGILSSHDLCLRGPLPKPAIAPFILDHRLQSIPYQEGASGIHNLSYIAFPADVAYEIRLFQEVVPFDRLAILNRDVAHQAAKGLRANLLEVLADLSLEIDFITVGEDVDAALASIPNDAEAAFITPMIGLSELDMNRLAEGLITRKLPSYSVMGTRDVKRGILVGTAPDFNIPRLARRVGLNVQRMLLGEDPGTFQVMFSREEQLTINMATARAIGVYPP